ncbi:helix-turn-helix domain-containing protein [Pyruvatibacter mobilis]|uniref:helix-turn-helix domain-containing protein n=1 Tax=Pyruvatibacter mobilis TaxID=1712261 RepID=UPI003BAA8DF8
MAKGSGRWGTKSQQSLADDAGMTRSQIAKIEVGESAVRTSDLAKIERALGVKFHGIERAWHRSHHSGDFARADGDQVPVRITKLMI